ncbi:protein of unknown function [Tindallia magadiensis]|uniref:Transcobalamin-like C-terminal domain-containing protein n=1 Tax=Tindallia magadiensis TaxID=69895 RepID=A0A1I3D7J9_9FIRM|nr:DUF4430 domain-containing protein [Tindallia magadiensis]SFH82704.1 protein of unknown function [Tindallia magadiensis]
MIKKRWKWLLVLAVLLSASFFIDDFQAWRYEIAPRVTVEDLEKNPAPVMPHEKTDQEEKEEPDLDKEEKASPEMVKNNEKERKEEVPEIKEEVTEANSKEEEKEEKEEAKEKKEVETKKEDTKRRTEQDQYLTDPVPEGKPEPVEWQDTEIDYGKKKTVRLSVTCHTILENLEMFNPDKMEVLPRDGIIFPEKEVVFYPGESAFDVTHRELKNAGIHMEFSMTPMYNSNYVEGIHNLYEFDTGPLSGWMYSVNGWFPNYGSSRYLLEAGDKIEWKYTCDLGRDLEGGAASWN